MQVKAELVTLDPYFEQLGSMMDVWLDAWEELNPGMKGFEAPTTAASA